MTDAALNIYGSEALKVTIQPQTDIHFEVSQARDQIQSCTKLIAGKVLSRYLKGMMKLHCIFRLFLLALIFLFLLALIFAVGANGVVMASNDVMHQKNCIHTSADDIPSDHAHHGHSDHQDSADNATPEHDHETCMMHACSAVTIEAHGAGEIPIALSAVLAAAEHELTPLGLAENFLRPPNT